VGTGGSTAGRGGTTGAGGTGGGTTGRGGTTGAGGTGGSTTGRGGTTGTAGGTGTNCVDNIRVMGYAYPGANPCSACVENNISREALCKQMLDCLEASYPCTGGCYLSCKNMGISGPTEGCVTALLTAASCSF
jgi:hypothetical protein